MNKQQLNFLRSLAHERKPVIWVGQQGLHESVLEEINAALDRHELVKIRLRVGDREAREKICGQICSRTNAVLVQKIGNTLSIYRRNDEAPVLKMPNQTF